MSSLQKSLSLSAIVFALNTWRKVVVVVRTWKFPVLSEAIKLHNLKMKFEMRFEIDELI